MAVGKKKTPNGMASNREAASVLPGTSGVVGEGERSNEDTDAHQDPKCIGWVAAEMLVGCDERS